MNDIYKCKGCNANYFATKMRRPCASGGATTDYTDDAGHKVTATRCYECVKEHNRQKMRNKKVKESDYSNDGEIDPSVQLNVRMNNCGHCGTLTINRYNCNKCWQHVPHLSYQDSPVMTPKEKQDLYNNRRGVK